MQLRFILTALLVASSCTAYRRGTSGIPAASSKNEFVAHPNLEYFRMDGRTLRADVFVPEKAVPQSGFPWVLLIHGGGWEKGNKEQMTPIAERLAKAGFGVMNINYRLSGIKKWPGALEDCQAAVRWMRANHQKFNFDPSRVASYGYSAGAHLALLVGNMSDQKLDGPPLRVVVNGAGPVDFSAYPDSGYVRKFMGVPFKGNEKLYLEASPLTHISKNSPPTYVYYGHADWIVGPEENEKLIAKLKANKVPVASDTAVLGHVATFLWDEKFTKGAIAFLRQYI